ncbi:hypothetical protein Tco_0612114, partial [Tanacetum coccineum]
VEACVGHVMGVSSAEPSAGVAPRVADENADLT